MRDPERIPKVLEAIREIWEKHPDLRLGQLLYSLAIQRSVGPGNPIFYAEDEDLLIVIEEWKNNEGARSSV